MNKTKLVTEIAARTRVPASDVAAVVDAFMDVVRLSVVRGDKVVLSGFGTFHRKARASRTARNISTGQALSVRATDVPAFRPGRPFRESVATRRKSRARARTPTA